ncbi:epoxide hydrolase 1-like isoform X1 [Limulus polyphemus]|uniref:Epoxide hydrolase n=2 Tax=Limulus polyphemus TaxID=6850 RepID=A0ABM1SB11_LIMPO|nr:epoxide hydrolase 1-like isoform X1 [Limulus polyphemus]
MVYHLLMGYTSIILLFGVSSAILIPLLWPDPDPPVLPDMWWGRGKMPSHPSKFPKDNTAIRPFTINVKNNTLQDLNHRLDNARLPEPLDNVQFQYGFHSKYLKKVIDYWRNEYDWRREERKLNQYPQFLTQIEGIDVHYLHIKPTIKNSKIHVIPLMLIHGWPGSVVEFYKIIPLLTTPTENRDFVFEVICPSIPGYGFSEAPHQPGFSVADAGRVFVKLMARLNFHKFYLQGGDWGSAISMVISSVYPENVLGVHLNFVAVQGGFASKMKHLIGILFPSLVADTPAQQRHLFSPFMEKVYYLLRETGYAHIQGTKPDTVGTGVSDSPAGLAAYILEKFSTWTNKEYVNLADGGLTKKFTLDELLTNVMVYWVTNSITSSMRLYKETMSERIRNFKFDRLPVTVPTGIAQFPNEIIMPPRNIAKHQYRNIIQYTDMPRGGHFPAFEEPKLLADDIGKFVEKVRTLEVSKNEK